MTHPQFKTGDWAKTRGGDVVGPIEVTERGMIKMQQNPDAIFSPTGHWFFASASLSEKDLIAVAEPPSKLPEPIERWANFYTPYRGCLSSYLHLGDAVHMLEQGGKTYRVRIEFLEEVK